MAHVRVTPSLGVADHFVSAMLHWCALNPYCTSSIVGLLYLLGTYLEQICLLEKGGTFGSGSVLN
jgi:hypothetical protein